MFKVSQSKTNAWRRCRREYHYRFAENLKPKVKSRPFMFGGIVHKMLEAYANGGKVWDVFREQTRINHKVFREEEEAYGEIAQDIEYIMSEYFEYWGKTYFLKVNGQCAEHPFEVALNSDIVVKGKIDAMMKGKKLMWLVEHKTHKNFPSPEHRWRNLQSVLYIEMVKKAFGIKLDGTLWDYIRSKSPTRPQLTTKGLMSERSIDTLPSVIVDFLKEHKLKGLYSQQIENAKASLPDWFQRIYTPYHKEVGQIVMRDFTETAIEMMKGHGKEKQHTFGRHCEWCQYRALCAAELQGHDVDFIKEREFVVDESEYQDTIEATD